jgi:hypothetical protein
MINFLPQLNRFQSPNGFFFMVKLSVTLHEAMTVTSALLVIVGSIAWHDRKLCFKSSALFLQLSLLSEYLLL